MVPQTPTSGIVGPMPRRRMAVFTGAGASRAIGYPLTRDLLPRVRSELKSDVLFKDTNGRKKDQEERQELSVLLHRLLPGFDDVADADLPLITDVFSLVEYAITSGETLPIGGDGVLRRCRDLLKHAITDILLGDFLEPWDRADPAEQRQRLLLGDFVKWMQQYTPQLGLITTNYDIGLEYELYDGLGRPEVSARVDLGFDWRDARTNEERTRPSAPSLRVYKLHGSLDVLKCSVCGYVYFNPYGAIAVHAFRDQLDDNNTCICRDDARLQLHIVSPSLVRDVRDASLLSVWRSALEWLRTADEWLIIGYSLPPEDLAVRSLLLRAYTARSQPPRITVIQQGDADRARYKLLFPHCTYDSEGLESFLHRPRGVRRRGTA